MSDKIFYISPNTFPSRAAHTVHIMNMCQSFSKLEKRITLVIPINRNNILKSKKSIRKFYAISENVSILQLPMLPTRIGLAIYAMFCLIMVRINKPKLCYTRNFFIANLLTKRNFKTIFETHGLEFDNLKKSQLLERSSLLRVVVISEALLQIYVDEGFDIAKFLVAHDGANLDLEEENDVVSTYDDNKFHVGYVGHLYKGRGIDLILNLAKHRDNLLFHIVGGLDDDINYWRSIALEMNIKNVVWEGYIPHNEATFLRRKFDILLAPYEQKVRVSGNTGDTSRWMSPLKIFEYMSDKKPILVSDLPVLHEVLKNEYNCLFCKVNDLNDWLSKIDILIEDRQLSEKISTNAYNDLKRKYTWDKRAQAVIDKV